MSVLRSTAVVLCSLAAGSAAFAQVEKKPDSKKESAVREIDVSGLRMPMARTPLKKPTVIADDKALAAAMPDEAARKAIGKQVDFDKQELLLFAWSGSGRDRLRVSVRAGKGGGKEHVFAYERGLTRDFRPHTKLFAIEKGAKWSLQLETP